MFTPQALAEAVHTAIELLPDVTVNGYHIEWRAPLVAHLTDDGDGAAVSDHYCGICREDRCRHTMAVAAAWDMALAEVFSDNTPDIDDRREAYYEAGHYPPSPVYY